MRDPLEYELRTLLNQHSRENESNTPDYILADYIMKCLEAYEKAVQQKEIHNNAKRNKRDKRD